MDEITKNIALNMIKSGDSIDLVSFELGISSQDIRTALQKIDQTKMSNILAEQLASRLPALLELACKQLQHIILNGDMNQRLRAINTVLQASTALAKIKPQ